MARTFAAGTIAWTGAFSTRISSSVGSVACWYRPTGAPASQSLVYQLPALIKDASGYVGMHRGNPGAAGDKIWAYNYAGAAITQVGFTYTVDVWVHCGWLHTGGNLSVFKDGVSQGSVASGNTDSLSGVPISGENALLGDLGEVAMWDVALDTAEWAALGFGCSPLMIRPASLTHYSPIPGYASPEPELIASAGGTVISATLAVHPRLVRPPGAQWVVTAAAAAQLLPSARTYQFSQAVPRASSW